jgi:hypothetical protein
MSAVCLLKNFDGTMPRLEVLPDGGRTRVLLHTRYWDREDRLVSADVEFSDVAAVRFSVNYLEVLPARSSSACMSWPVRRKSCGCCGRTLTDGAGISS